MAITLTDKAKEHIRKHLEKRGQGVGIRLGVKTTGCSGLSYILEFMDKTDHGDKLFDQSGFLVAVDPKSLIYLDGTELDFIKDGLNEGFSFSNPNSKSECGCGESFNV